jgi:catechol 2,3-dioxygenase-like lactoylglutathione lyase family enzyme
MKPFNFTLLYVADSLASAAFYADLLGRPPVDSSPGFAMFALDGGTMLGLWAQRGVEPAATMKGGGGELALAVENDAAVDALHADWTGRGVAIAQAPTRMDFGYTFLGLDPDAHRLRVFAPGGA